MKRVELLRDVEMTQQDQDTLAEGLNAVIKSQVISFLKEKAKKQGEILRHMHSRA